jgi:hypothetical protein
VHERIIVSDDVGVVQALEHFNFGLRIHGKGLSIPQIYPLQCKALPIISSSIQLYLLVVQLVIHLRSSLFPTFESVRRFPFIINNKDDRKLAINFNNQTPLSGSYTIDGITRGFK